MSSDIVLKNYWSGNEEFADLFNAVLFGGSQIIRADELENEDTEDSVVLEHRKQAEGVKAARDNIKIMKKSTAYGVQLVLLGLESQEHIHYAMPLRVMGMIMPLIRNSIIIMPDNTKSSQHSRMQDLTSTNFYPK